jgi:hypothetical protein
VRLRVGSGRTPATSRAMARDVSRLRAYWSRRRRLLLAAFAMLAAVGAVRGWRHGASEGEHARSLARSLAREGLRVDPRAVVWLEDGASPLRARDALFLARAGGELDDLYFAAVRCAGDGAVLDVHATTNLTRTSSAAEGAPVRLGDHVLYASRVGDRFDAVTLLDVRGEPASLTADWPFRARIQNAITNAQETGRTAGFGKRRYALVTPATRIVVAREAGRFVLSADGARIVLDPARDVPVEGGPLVELRPAEKSIPGSITWIVDTVRNLSFVGAAPIEWLEHTVFGMKDRFERVRYALAGDANEESDEAAAELGGSRAATPGGANDAHVLLEASDADSGWPPAPLTPILADPLRGEGEWVAVDDAAFVQRWPHAPPPFYQTFVRPDDERRYARVFVTAWDARQVQLHIAMGTREPESATGETGTGLVPRDARTLSRLVAGFNGGFQALHGEFGMMADGRVYLPPKPWAATVAVFEDGRVGLGSWPAPASTAAYDERAATAQIPEGMVAMRQNLTTVVEDGRYNPWERWWWGAAPEAATEQTFTHRSGLCVTREGFLAFFWGGSLGPEALGAAMNATRCVRGMHLDMNSKHTGLEFYRLARDAASLPPLPDPLPDDAWEGPLPNPEGATGTWTVRARKAVRSMDPMRFPRYIRRDPRDFFFLTLRPMLPGPDLPGLPGQAPVALSTQGLPRVGWPYPFARAGLGADGARAWVVRIDAARVPPGPLSPVGASRTLAYLARGRGLARDGAAFALYAVRATTGGALGLEYAVGAPPAGARVLVAGADAAASAGDAGAAIGVDGEGYVVYVERDGSELPLATLLRAAGVARAVTLPEGVRLAFRVGERTVAVDGARERSVDEADALAWIADERSAAEALFPDTAPLPYTRWGRLQGARVRYFPDANRAPRFVRPPGTR